MSHHRCCCGGVVVAGCPCNPMPTTLYVTDNARGLTVACPYVLIGSVWSGTLTTTVPANPSDPSCNGTTLGTIGYTINCQLGKLRFTAQAGCDPTCNVGTTMTGCAQTGIYTPVDSGYILTPTCSPFSTSYTNLSVGGRVNLFFFGGAVGTTHSVTWTITG